VILIFIAATIFLTVGLIFYIYFALKDPDYLRSESFQLRKQSITVLGDKENQFNDNLKEIPSITNPYILKTKGEHKDLEL